MSSNRYEVFTEVLRLEAKAIEASIHKITEGQMTQLSGIYEWLTQSGGSLLFCGVGKSGIIANKLASTFCSLGLPSWFLHPVEALHGDLGRVGEHDALVFISKSGNTEEILKLFPYLSIEKDRMIGLLGQTNSKISSFCGLVFNCEVEKEACLNNQAPTTSSTLALAMGDAMAVSYEDFVNLSKEHFAINHPGGLLGKMLKLKVKDLMVLAIDCPILTEDLRLKDVILAMTITPLGGCAICTEDGYFKGIIVEGDIRRTFSKEKNLGLETKIKDMMNSKPLTTHSEALAIEALKVMEQKSKQVVQILPVLDRERKFLGFIRWNDLLKEGMTGQS